MKEDCDSCGKIDAEGYWKNSDGRVLCDDCMNIPLDILQEIHKKTEEFVKMADEGELFDTEMLFDVIRKIKERIEEFDDEADGAVLDQEEDDGN